MNRAAVDPYALVRVVAIIQDNADNKIPTDIYALADVLQKDLPSLSRCDLIQLIERTIVTVGGAAIWHKR